MNFINITIEQLLDIDTQIIFLPVIVFFSVIFILSLFRYNRILKSKIIQRVFIAHNIYEGDETKIKPHFHNTDRPEGEFNIAKKIVSDSFDWSNRRYLFVYPEKLCTFDTVGDTLTLQYNAHYNMGETYKFKSVPNHWPRIKTSKRKIEEYNGTFVMLDTMVRTINLKSLLIDNKTGDMFDLTFNYTNGISDIISVTTEDFYEDITSSTSPYNMAYLNDCMVFELK